MEAARDSRPSSRKRPPRQAELPLRQHGGRRAGAGRKPKHGEAGVSHAARGPFTARFPVLVTLKRQRGLPRLRSKRERTELLAAFAAANERPNAPIRLVHFAILNDHLHLLVEARDRDALRRGLQGLAIRIARGLNRLWARRGKVWADRYHDRPLKTPREVRNALVYVFGNGHKHAAEGREVAVAPPIDVYTSAAWFDGFREQVSVRGLPDGPAPVARPRTWLLATGWRRHGLLSVDERPGSE
jgi:REP element-mobilizing transposase RayT